MAKVEKMPNGCWLFRGCLTTAGYGAIGDNYRKREAHIVAFENLVGPVPAGLELDHTCRTPACVNPAHLEPVTHRENILRGTTPEVQRKRHANRTHCKRGHALTPENVRRIRRGAYMARVCIACRRRAGLETYYRSKGKQPCLRPSKTSAPT